MNETQNSKSEKKRKMLTILEIETREGKSRGIPRFVFRLKYVEQALFFNLHFLMMIMVGIFGIIFTPLKTSINWINESIDFLNAIILGIGVGGVICWCFVYKLKKAFANEISPPVWMACHILLNICHILSVLFILGFFLSVGIKQNDSMFSLACGVFSSMIYGIMLSIKYAYKS